MRDGKMTTDRLPGLDGLRAVSIALVIGYHLQLSASSHGWVTSFFNNGTFGVDVFFTISGFLITWLLLREESARGSISLRQFYVRRGVRILPAAFAYLLVILVLSLLHGTMKWKPWFSAALFYRNLVMNDRLAPGAVDTSHYWSLSIEEQFYLIWPTLFLLLRPRARVPVLLALFLAAPAWRELNLHGFHATNVNLVRIDMHCDGILIGCLLACVIEDSRFRKILSHPLFHSDLIALTCLAIIVGSFTARAGSLPGYVRFTYPTIRAACVALFVFRVIRRTGRGESALDRFLNLNGIVILGQLSYSLYLWQQPFCMPSGVLRTNSEVANVMAACACAAASFLLIERPAQFLRRKLTSRPARVFPGSLPPQVPSSQLA